VLTVTEDAKKYLRQKLLANNTDPEVGLRLTTEPTRQFGIILDRQGVGDYVVKYEDCKVLLIAPELLSCLDKVTIDTNQTTTGKQLLISKD
jgi:Fe-S cluster assembly iron-binding protein IscA